MKIIIFGPARSGTTTLVSTLRRHPDISSVNYEPFRDGLPTGLWKIKHDRLLFNQAVDELFKESDVLKSLIGEIPWSMLLDYFNKADRVLLTWRQNVLKAAVSECLSKQTGVWQKHEAKEGYGSFKPLNIKQVEKHLKSKVDAEKWTYYIAASTSTPCLRITYEDMFLNDDHEDQLNAMWDFLDLDRPSGDVREGIQEFLETSRLNSERTYLKIPNVYEIERKLGNNQTGWLLNGGLLI